MSYSYKLILSYDGTRYLGWQKTRMGPSIQESLLKAIAQITGETTSPEAASRTDRGVHAEGQSVCFALQKPAEPRRLLQGLNGVLPTDIRVAGIEPSPLAFHPTLDASGKEYHYRLCLGAVQDPTQRLYSWHFHYPLDLDGMRSASKDLLGTHDFTAFANEKGKDPLCTLEAVEITPLPENRLQIAVKGNRFLYKMVRNIVGTLLYIGAGKLPKDAIPGLLASRDRKKGGITAPSHGLYLHKVFYRFTITS